MKKKIRIIFFLCCMTVVLFTAWSAIRSFRPSRGKPYERLSAEEAYEYISYESVYCIIDVRDPKAYAGGHVEGAKNLPFEEIVERADDVIADRHMMLYVYGRDSEQSCAAAQKLSDSGFTSVTETGSYRDWILIGIAEETADTKAGSEETANDGPAQMNSGKSSSDE